jgi:hypothetical protein
MVQFFVWTIGLVCVGIVTVHMLWGRIKPRNQSSQTELANLTPSNKPGPLVVTKPVTPKRSEAAGGNVSRVQSPVDSSLHVAPTPAARELVDSLVRLDVGGGSMSDAQAIAWKENLKRLIQQGDASIPAINEFLAKNADVLFDKETSNALGFSSARMAMIDALTQIGTPQAIGALDSVLQTSEGPQEIATVIQYLEKTDPGMFLQHAFDAAQRVLGNVANGSVAKVDVGALFQVLLQYEYGNAYTVSVLKDNASQWNRYATIALAQLPDGAGVPALIQIATSQEGSSAGARSAALQALSGMASQSAIAQEALLGLARQNSLSADDWVGLIPFLAGNQNLFKASVLENPVAGISPNDLRGTYIGSNCQNYWTAPLGALTVSQISQQSAFLDQMLNVTTNPAGIQALQQARAMLDNRRVILANSSGQ